MLLEQDRHTYPMTIISSRIGQDDALQQESSFTFVTFSFFM